MIKNNQILYFLFSETPIWFPLLIHMEFDSDQFHERKKIKNLSTTGSHS